jgi:hypothetical protein
LVETHGERQMDKHAIDPFNSQYHDLHWADIDGDGQPELVTGKRYLAHCGHDPGEYDDLGIYYFKWTGSGFAKQVISHGRRASARGAASSSHWPTCVAPAGSTS